MERKGKFEELVVASNEIAASTAQLVCSHFHVLIFMFSFSCSHFHVLNFMFSFSCSHFLVLISFSCSHFNFYFP